MIEVKGTGFLPISPHLFAPSSVKGQQEGRLGDRSVQRDPSQMSRDIGSNSIHLASEATPAMRGEHHSPASHVANVGRILNLAALIKTIDGVKEFKESYQIKDLQGMAIGLLKMLESTLRATSGLMFTGMMAATLALMKTGAKAAEVASKVLGVIGEGAFAISTAFGALIASIQIYRLYRAQDEIKGRDPVELIKLEMKMDPELKSFWTKILGEALIQRLETDSDVKKLGDDIQICIDKKMKEAVTLLILNILGTTIAILSFVFTGGAAPLAFAIIEIALALMWVAIEGQHIIHAQDTKNMSARQKALVYLSTLFSLAVMITTTVLHVDLIPKIGSIIVGLALLIVHLIAIGKMRYNEMHA